MSVEFTKEMLEKINSNFKKRRPTSKMKLDCFIGATVYDNHWAVATIEDIERVINELEEMRQAIKEESGVIC